MDRMRAASPETVTSSMTDGDGFFDKIDEFSYKIQFLDRRFTELSSQLDFLSVETMRKISKIYRERDTSDNKIKELEGRAEESSSQLARLTTQISDLNHQVKKDVMSNLLSSTEARVNELRREVKSSLIVVHSDLEDQIHPIQEMIRIKISGMKTHMDGNFIEQCRQIKALAKNQYEMKKDIKKEVVDDLRLYFKDLEDRVTALSSQLHEMKMKKDATGKNLMEDIEDLKEHAMESSRETEEIKLKRDSTKDVFYGTDALES